MNKCLARAGVASLALLTLAAFALMDRVKDDPLAATGCAVFGLAFLLGIFWAVALDFIIADQADDVERLRGDKEAAWRWIDEHRRRADELERRLMLKHECMADPDSVEVVPNAYDGECFAVVKFYCEKCGRLGNAGVRYVEALWEDEDDDDDNEEKEEGDNK